MANSTDCNDSDGAVHAPITYYKDADTDGFGSATVTTSVCSATAPATYVTNSSDCNDAVVVYADNDHDGFGAGAKVSNCVGTGYVANSSDCDDTKVVYRDSDGDGFGYGAAVTNCVGRAM